MNGGFDFGILILGLSAVALIAGSSPWIWEILSKPKGVSATKTKVDSYVPKSVALSVTESSNPEPDTSRLISELLPEEQETPASLLQEECAHQLEEELVDGFELKAKTARRSETFTDTVQEQMDSDQQLEPEPGHAEVKQESLILAVEEVPVVSTNIQTVLYHTEFRLLQLRFYGGSVYWYFEVPHEVYKALMEAESKGQFGQAHIYSAFSQKSIGTSEAQTFWNASQSIQRETFGSLIHGHNLIQEDWTAKKPNPLTPCTSVGHEDLDDTGVPEMEQESEEETSLEELRKNAIEAISDPVTDKALVLKDFFGWKDDFFSQADVDFISSCLDYDRNEDFDHPSDRIAHCRDLILGYPPSPIKLEVLIWMTRFADQHDRYTDGNNLLHDIATILKVFLGNQELALKERFDFGMTVQELLMNDISETQSDPTFETDTLLCMLITLGQSDGDLISVQKRAKRLLRYCKRISQQRFTIPSKDPGINKNKDHLRELIERINSFQRTVIFSRKNNDDNKI